MNMDWREYIDDDGVFSLPAYLYKMITELMKHALDMGTLLSDDVQKTRAFKEEIKKTYKNQWIQIAQVLESFEIIERCDCYMDSFCEICKGSRYLLNPDLAPKPLDEICLVLADTANIQSAISLKKETENIVKNQVNYNGMSKVSSDS